MFVPISASVRQSGLVCIPAWGRRLGQGCARAGGARRRSPRCLECCPLAGELTVLPPSPRLRAVTDALIFANGPFFCTVKPNNESSSSEKNTQKFFTRVISLLVAVSSRCNSSGSLGGRGFDSHQGLFYKTSKLAKVTVDRYGLVGALGHWQRTHRAI